MHFDYEALLERQVGAVQDDSELVGVGDFKLIGEIELVILREAGLRPTDALVDFGCGTGRLAVHAIPHLVGGHYTGVEISRPTLERAEAVVARACPDPTCRVVWLHNTAPTLPLDDASADLLCAFSVFTHMEHEDAYGYLVDARRVVRPGGRLVFSCLPIDEPLGREVFLAEAALPLVERWQHVRNVTTSLELIGAVAELAGWRVAAWYGGDHCFALPDGRRAALGQAVCVLT